MHSIVTHDHPDKVTLRHCLTAHSYTMSRVLSSLYIRPEQEQVEREYFDI